MAGPKLTKLDGFFLFLVASKLYSGDTGKYKPWFPVAHKSWIVLKKYQRKQWNALAKQIRESPLGLYFLFVDGALKSCDTNCKEKQRILLHLRDQACEDLYKESRSLLTWTLEDGVHKTELNWAENQTRSY